MDPRMKSRVLIVTIAILSLFLFFPPSSPLLSFPAFLFSRFFSSFFHYSLYSSSPFSTHIYQFPSFHHPSSPHPNFPLPPFYLSVASHDIHTFIIFSIRLQLLPLIVIHFSTTSKLPSPISTPPSPAQSDTDRLNRSNLTLPVHHRIPSLPWPHFLQSTRTGRVKMKSSHRLR